MSMELTELLQRVHAGEREALDTVIPLVYTELKKLAASWQGDSAAKTRVSPDCEIYGAY